MWAEPWIKMVVRSHQGYPSTKLLYSVYIVVYQIDSRYSTCPKIMIMHNDGAIYEENDSDR